jgi:predicted restriction endonuclease
MATRAKISVANRGKKRTAKARARMSISQKRRFEDPTRHPRWMGGISMEPYAWTFNAELKEEVRRRDNYRCQVCGVPQTECKNPLYVHHVDYDKKNSDPDNLISLCPSCHTRTNANRESWRILFQKMMLKRILDCRCEVTE